jgi:hypothetical protein
MLLNICCRYERMRCSRMKQHNCRSVVDEKHTNGNVRSFQGFLHSNMVDSPMGIVLLSSNSNRVSSMGRRRCGHSCLRRAGARIGALVGVVTSLTTSIALPLRRNCIMSRLGSLSIPISSSMGLEVIGALSHLPLWHRESLSSCLLLWLKLRLSRMKHTSS